LSITFSIHKEGCPQRCTFQFLMEHLYSDVRCTCYISTYTTLNYQLIYKISNGHAYFSDSVPAPPLCTELCACVYVCVCMYAFMYMCMCVCVCVCTCSTGVQKSSAQGLVTTKHFKMAPNVCGYSESYLLHATLQMPGTLDLRWSLECWKICTFLVYDKYFFIWMHAFIHVNMCICIYFFPCTYEDRDSYEHSTQCRW
jgi:hypothetical protein